MKTKHLSVLLPIAMSGLSNAAWSATVDTEDSNDTFANPDTWAWQSDNFNDARVDDDVDFFRLTGFVPGSQVRVTFASTSASDDGPIRLDAFNTTQVQGDNVTLNAVLGTMALNAPLASANFTIAIPSNGQLGLKLTDEDLINGGTEGYRITIEVLSVPSNAAAVPIAAWPVVPMLGAAGLAALRRKQKRPAEKQAA